MMTPEEVLLESIAAASLHGDSPALRKEQIAKLAESLKLYCRITLATDAHASQSA